MNTGSDYYFDRTGLTSNSTIFHRESAVGRFLQQAGWKLPPFSSFEFFHHTSARKILRALGLFFQCITLRIEGSAFIS